MVRWVDMGVGGMERTMEMAEGVCERVRVGHGLSLLLLLLARGSDGSDMIHVALAHVERLGRRRRWGSTSVAVAVSWNDIAERVGPVSVAHGIPLSFAVAQLPLPHDMLFALAVVEVAHSVSFTLALSFSEIFVPGTAGPSLTLRH